MVGITCLIFLIIYVILHFLFKPKIEITANDDLILWYGRKAKRNYTFLIRDI